MERYWELSPRDGGEFSAVGFNVAPTARVPILVQNEGGTLDLKPARWGLIPHWWKKAEAPTRTFNARSEEARTKPMWRGALRSQRCLMPALGWYEWQEKPTSAAGAARLAKQPWFIHGREQQMMAFAALWSVWNAPAGEAVVSCAALTREAAPSIAAIHHRMPVVLDREQQQLWLDASTNAEDVEDLMANSRQDFESYPVSTRVNSTRNVDAALLEPLPDQRSLV